MKLSRALPSDADLLRTFRHGVLGALVGLLLTMTAGIFALVLTGLAWAHLAWFALALAAPVALAAACVWLLVAGAFASAIRASLRSTNWLLALGPRTLCLNLRSYLNAPLEGDDPTVLHLDLAEIQRARRVREIIEREGFDGRERHLLDWLELELCGVDTAPVAEALRRERLRPAPERSFLGVRTRSRFHHRPVLAPAPGVLRVEWRRGMLAALEERGVKIERDLTRAPTLAPEITGHARALVERGRPVEAALHLRESEGIDLVEAKRRVAELERAH